MAGCGIWKGGEEDFRFSGEEIPVGFFEVEIGFDGAFCLLFVRIGKGNEDGEVVRIEGS